MISKQTIFVIGAGANAGKYRVGKDDPDYGGGLEFPTGPELIKKIVKRLRGIIEKSHTTNVLEQTILKLYKNGELTDAIDHLINNLPNSPSIDNFLYENEDVQGLEKIGKILIYQEIQESEKSCILRETKFDPSAARDFIVNIENPWQNPKVWVNQLLMIIKTQVKLVNIDDMFEKCTFVIFNYDRVIQHHFHTSIMNSYRISSKRAAAIIDKARFIHPYGSLGKLPWQSHADDDVVLPFGGQMGNESLRNFENIDTFNETTKIEGVKKDILQAYDVAQNVVFLGFGFHAQNMKLMEKKSDGHKKFFFTSFGFNDANIYDIKNTLAINVSKSHAQLQQYRNDQLMYFIEAKEPCSLFLKNHFRMLG